ncbi:hypothetical protein JTB14_014741 [Gonioctena quinquepunctata]|nr:hypothetical protein JTB14_014741 [Gonioctena quinquepunctata]
MKSLYDLEQSARSWNETIHNAMIKIGFQQSKTDQCYGEQCKQCNVLIYVDDILIISESESIISESAICLQNEFELSCSGDITCYLGIDIEEDSNGDYFITKEDISKNYTDSQFG